MDHTRRQVLGGLSSLLALTAGWMRFASAQSSPVADAGRGNFRYIYGNETYRREFRDFLVNVFRLYPEEALHARITALSEQLATDEEVYQRLQAELDEIKPFLSELTHALPTLRRQKKVLAMQTMQLLGSKRSVEGYLEIGSNGRFLDALEERLQIKGGVFVVSPQAPTNAVFDIIDRGQLAKAGKFIALDNYETRLSANIPPNSVELVTVYIGFHHCPPGLRASFFDAIRGVMKPGGELIVRDHDVRDERMWHMVALAHDVFNMGTRESWSYNERELRKFYPLSDLDRMLVAAGFRSDGVRLLQRGDPTLNTLMRYRKV